MDIKEICKREGFEFVPHTDKRAKAWIKKVEVRKRWRFFIRIRDWFTLNFL